MFPLSGRLVEMRGAKKVGIITKSFKIKKEIADAYKEACDKAGVSQAGQITKMMKDFVEAVSKKS